MVKPHFQEIPMADFCSACLCNESQKWESYFSKKPHQLPGRWGSTQQNKESLTVSLILVTKKTCCVVQVCFFGGKWAKSRARLGHGHKSAWCKRKSFLRTLCLGLPHTCMCCLLQKYLPNTPVPQREHNRIKRTKGEKEKGHPSKTGQTWQRAGPYE